MKFMKIDSGYKVYGRCVTLFGYNFYGYIGKIFFSANHQTYKFRHSILIGNLWAVDIIKIANFMYKLEND